MKIEKMSRFFILLFLFFSMALQAQNNNTNTWQEKIRDWKIQPIIGLQLWSTYTIGTEVYNEETGQYESVDDRINTELRRSRLGIKGQPYQNLKFNITAALDLVGKDLLAGTEGGGNNGASPNFRIWNAYVQWKIRNKNDGLHLTAGYLTPQIGRESITGAFNVSSMEKAWSQNYLRRQLTGTGPGRAMGLNVGGLLFNDNRAYALSYDFGIFNPVYEAYNGNSVGSEFSALLVGRVVLHIGAPEFEKYTISHKTNYRGQRKGVSIALAGAYQRETILFEKQMALGTDLLLNWGQLNVDGEWTFLRKAGNRKLNNKTITFNSDSNTGYLRISYNLRMPKERILEPSLMVVQFNGALDASGQIDAAAVNAFAGTDYSYSFGVNYHLNPDLKLSLHYTIRQADAGDADEGASFNNYFFQSGVGAIHRGDWLGLGAVFVF